MGAQDAELAASRSSETWLWRAVVHRAFLDAAGSSGFSHHGTTTVETIRARAWLTGAGRDFALTCHLADLDPEAVRNRALQLEALDWPRNQAAALARGCGHPAPRYATGSRLAPPWGA